MGAPEVTDRVGTESAPASECGCGSALVLRAVVELAIDSLAMP